MNATAMNPKFSRRTMRWLAGGAVAAWVMFIAYCWRSNVEAAKLAIILPPIFGTAFVIALRARSVVLSLFMGFTFVSHAIAPPFFFLKRENYSYGGDFGAVKNFSFQAGELLRIYGTVCVFTLAVLLFTIAGVKMVRGEIPWSGLRLGRPKTQRRGAYDFLIIGFLIAVAVPQSILMYKLRVGITGVVAPALPFRLTGILYYSRSFIYPVLLFIAYALSKRSRATAVVIVLYAWFAALCGSSRYVLVISAASVVLFAVVDGRRIRFLASAATVGFAFLTVTHSREYIYSDALPFREYLLKSVGESEERPPVGDLIGAIALRLYGPQDIVLAYQYDVPDRVQAMARWFTDRPVVDLNYEFYGMILEPGSGFGVGIGLAAWMIVLARRSYIFLIALAGVIAIFLIVADIVVLAVRRTKAFNASMIADPLAFFLVYVLYSATSLRWYYELIVISTLATWMLRMLNPATHDRSPRLVPQDVQ